MSIGTVSLIIVVFISAMVIALKLPLQRPSAGTNPVCPPAKNTDREFKDTLRYAKELIPYRDER